ncbi:MAG: hypothetical protein AVDCRST_MAG56-6449 [uncultured Cytophagales bacterium]|uniref:Uncharacterized protein n=1 Tax=uncultured Cytophagales bacterium TaxID=158755 RepID=A0A6J4KGC7_9SPHI|nr:MAG: hypothetical protein AVDCRST_MAG56-6449 [uncultured Cytophagales bacterium]
MGIKQVHHGETEGTELHGEKRSEEREVRSEKNSTARGARKTQSTQGVRVFLAPLAVEFVFSV